MNSRLTERSARSRRPVGLNDKLSVSRNLFSLCNLCVLCVSVVDQLTIHSPQRRREHEGCTEGCMTAFPTSRFLSFSRRNWLIPPASVVLKVIIDCARLVSVFPRMS